MTTAEIIVGRTYIGLERRTIRKVLAIRGSATRPRKQRVVYRMLGGDLRIETASLSDFARWAGEVMS